MCFKCIKNVPNSVNKTNSELGNRSMVVRSRHKLTSSTLIETRSDNYRNLAAVCDTNSIHNVTFTCTDDAKQSIKLKIASGD